MAIEQGWCHCPQCKKWVPEQLMNHDIVDGKLIRVCTPCLEGTSDQNDYVYDPLHGKTKCIYCGSYDTVEQAPKWLWFTCQSCGKTFRRM